MSSELDNTDQLKHFYDDCRANGIEFLPPDINESDYRFTPYPNMKIRYALGAIKGTGRSRRRIHHRRAAKRRQVYRPLGLLRARRQRTHEPPHPRSPDTRRRVRQHRPNRAMLLANIDLAMNNADQKAANANQGGLFDMMEDAIEPVQLVDVPMWSESEKLAEEKTVIGFYLSGHPFGPYAQEVRQIAPDQIRPSETARTACASPDSLPPCAP